MEKYATDLKDILATDEQIQILKEIGVNVDVHSLSYDEAEKLIMKKM